MRKENYLLSIGGLDPCGYSGILADSRTWSHFKLQHGAVVTAITAQSKKHFFSWQASPIHSFQSQLESIDKKIIGIKIGMLATLSHVESILDWMRNKRPRHILWDPVLRSSSGYPLLKVKNMHPLLWELLKNCTVVTPNIDEANWMLKTKIQNLQDMKEIAKEIFIHANNKNLSVVLKGGHLPNQNSQYIEDIYYNGKDLKMLRSPRLKGDPRGTGCTFGAAMLAQLSMGKPPGQAARLAKDYVVKTLWSK